MANAAHCAYCFETLAAGLEDRDPLEYAQVLSLWAQYQSSLAPAEEGQPDDGEESMDGPRTTMDVEDGDEDAVENLPGRDAQPKPTSPTTKNGLRLPSILRLQASPAASASPAPSTPSSLSTASSSAALGDESKSSSNSSFFSFGRSKQTSPLPPPPREEEHPLFVTWNTVSQRSGHKSLRGCIGTFEAHELSRGLRDYALTAAFDDTRFPPISRDELATLSCSITLLTNFTTCKDAFDWDLGTHGIRISFMYHGKRYGATYLPDVSVQDAPLPASEHYVTAMMGMGRRMRYGSLPSICYPSLWHYSRMDSADSINITGCGGAGLE